MRSVMRSFGYCRVRMKGVRGRRELGHTLSVAEREEDYILTCHAIPEGDVVLKPDRRMRRQTMDRIAI